MNGEPISSLWVSITVGIVLSVLYALFGDHFDNFLKRLAPDPKKGFRVLTIAGCAIYVFVALAISIYILLVLLGALERTEAVG